MTTGSTAAEAAFWDDHVPDLESLVAAHRRGPSAQVSALIDSLEPLAGVRVLDFACGTGLLSVWLSERGANVVGLDVSPQSIARAQELAAEIRVECRFHCGPLTEHEPPGVFDRVAGVYALHHVDLAVVAPLLASRLTAGGTGAFVETMGTNPLFRVARRYVGRVGIASYGSPDEKPLTRPDLEVVRAAFGTIRLETPEMVFGRLLDRQVLRFRWKRASKALAWSDNLLLRARLGGLSYHRLVVVRKG
jgi:SAM-dependent methyltransferase